MDPTLIQIVREIGGSQLTQLDCSRVISNTSRQFLLTADVVTDFTVPASAFLNFVVYFHFSKAADVFVQFDDTTVLAFPTATVTDTSAVLNPAGYKVQQGQPLQFLTAETGVFVTLEFYRLQT